MVRDLYQRRTVTHDVVAAFSLNCSGMYRGIIRADGIPLTAIFREDPLE
jgi:hypothetical protein